MVDLTPEDFNELVTEPPLRLLGVSPVVLHHVSGAVLQYDLVITLRSEADVRHPGEAFSLLLRSDRASFVMLRDALIDALT